MSNAIGHDAVMGRPEIGDGEALAYLLPRPHFVLRRSGACALHQATQLRVDLSDGRVLRRALAWRKQLPTGVSVGRCGEVCIAVDRARIEHTQGYRLEVEPTTIEIVGGCPAGCFYALQTLTQLTDFTNGTVPCCRVEDRPSFATRGLLHDVTRGKVPKLDTLKVLVDRLAAWKVNQLQLYIEHAFTFAFDPEICDAQHGLTPDEVRELDAYCKDRFIDLVPAVATLGHMGRILSLPRYRHLAEIEPTQSWEEMSWPQRARGLTLDIANPQSHRLVECIWNDILDAFSSPVVNMCGDEPWDLGKGKNSARFSADGTGRAYLDHLRRTHDICSVRGRRTQVWSDVVRNHPELFAELPPDLTVLHWGYDDKSDYDGTRAFVEAGMETIVCPGTSGWKRIINAMQLAESNITAFAAAGVKHGAIGLLNTDWGDHGHFNALACSWHAIALGAAMAWSQIHPCGAAFDEMFARTSLGLPDATVIRLLRDASHLAAHSETWRLLWMPWTQIAEDSTMPAEDDLQFAGQSARSAGSCLGGLVNNRGPDTRELALACRFTELLCDRIALRRHKPHGKKPMADWRESVFDAAEAYRETWLARNKPSGIDDIIAALHRVAEEPMD